MSKKYPTKAHFNFKIDYELKNRLQKIADIEKRSLNNLIIWMLTIQIEVSEEMQKENSNEQD